MSSSSPSPHPQTLHSPPITIILTVILLIFFLLGFFSIYFCRCITQALLHTWHLRRGTLSPNNPNTNTSRNGLDISLIKSHPTFLYSSIKDPYNNPLECAICLVEFTDDSFLRLITFCCHVFHQQCIDLWLDSHKTCPVCRKDLEIAQIFPPPTHTAAFPPTLLVELERKEEREMAEVARAERLARVLSAQGLTRDVADLERFSRSHSTGHSIVENGRGRRWRGSCEEYRWERRLALARLRYDANISYNPTPTHQRLAAPGFRAFTLA